MIVQAEEMARDVRVAIDMNRTDTGLFTEGDLETLSVDEVIVSKLAEGVRLVELEAPRRLLESGHNLGGEIFWEGRGAGFVILPDDFMRLLSFRMSDWERTVHEAIDDTDPRYALQSSRWAGIRGNPEKPVVAVVRRPVGLVAEFYSCRSEGAWLREGTYVAEPRIDRDGGIDVAAGCYRAAVYRAAGLVLATLGDAQAASTMVELSRGLLGG